MKPIRILELRSVWGTGGGPEKTILRGTARTDPQRFAITVCYIRDLRDPVFGIDKTAATLPIDYVELRERHSLDPAIVPALWKLVRERRIDIVHAHDYKTNLLAAFLYRFGGVQALSTVHGWDGVTWRERNLYYPADRQVLRSLPRVIAVSDPVRDQLLRSGVRSSAVRMVPNGIDAAAYRRRRSNEAGAREALGLEPGQFVIGTVGRLTQAKRYDLLIAAVAELRRAHSHVQLLIAGDGPLKDALEAQIRQRGASAYCRLLGHRPDVVELHHAFDLFVLSSDTEGTPNAVLEAMALETPVVATDVGGTKHLVRHDIDGVLVRPGNPAALASAIDGVLRDPQRSRAWIEHARHRVETDLSFEARMAKIEAVYGELMGPVPRTESPDLRITA